MIQVLCLTKIPEDRRSDLTCIDGYQIYFEDDTYPIEEIEIILGNPSMEMIQQAKNLKWIQLNSAGANTYQSVDENIQLTNASGAYGEAISEHMLGCVLMVQKKLAPYLLQQKSHAWTRLGNVKTLSQSTVVSVGMGDIGSTFAKKIHALGAKVIGVCRNVHDKPDYVEKLVTMQDMDEALKEADIVALSLPETSETIHMFDYDRLKTIKEGAILVNVGRGSAIDENALIKVMREKHLAGVCLDVTEIEPLPQNNPLWTCENVYITPHISGGFSAEVTFEKVLSIMIDNLKRYQNNEPLQHIVDKKIGY